MYGVEKKSDRRGVRHDLSVLIPTKVPLKFRALLLPALTTVDPHNSSTTDGRPPCLKEEEGVITAASRREGQRRKKVARYRFRRHSHEIVEGGNTHPSSYTWGGARAPAAQVCAPMNDSLIDEASLEVPHGTQISTEHTWGKVQREADELRQPTMKPSLERGCQGPFDSNMSVRGCVEGGHSTLAASSAAVLEMPQNCYKRHDDAN